MFSYTGPDAPGTSLLRLCPARCQTAVTARLAQGDTPGQPRPPIELMGVRQDGSEFPLDLSLSVWSTAQGTYVTGYAPGSHGPQASGGTDTAARAAN